jgi:hypothetical protein
MLVGYNHNIRYRGDVFHVQSEDSGLNNPHIITLLYRGGTILASKKTSYADIIKIENLDKVLEEIMKDQHKDMLRRLKAGEFDDRAFPGEAPAAVATPTSATTSASATPAVSATLPGEPRPDQAPPESTPDQQQARKADVVVPHGRTSTLDEIILDYLLTDGNGQ